MSILVKKSEPNNLINTEEKKNNFLEITEYKENLEFEVLETFSKKISNFIGENDYQKVIEFTEKQLYLLNQAFTDKSEKIKIQNTDFHFELPLKRKNSDIIGNINELIINEKVKFRNFFIYLKKFENTKIILDFYIKKGKINIYFYSSYLLIYGYLLTDNFKNLQYSQLHFLNLLLLKYCF